MATEIVLTPLPNGVVDGELLASIHVAPRLTAVGGVDTLLEDYPLFTDWPSTLTQLGGDAFEVTVDGVPVNVTISSAPDSAVWRAAFPADSTGVFSHTVPDFSNAPIHSFPAAAVQSFLATEYGKYGVSGPEAFPLATDLLDPTSLGPIDFSGRAGAERRDDLLDALTTTRNRSGFVSSSATSSNVAAEFAQVLDFHTPPTTNRLPRIPLIDIDFHRAVTLVQSYPTLLRLLGLVVDVRLTPPDGAAIPTGIVGVQADIDWARLTPPSMTRPITGATYDPTTEVFRTAGRSGTTFDDLKVVDGFLPFDDGDRYQVVQVDTDGAVEKLTGLAGGMRQATTSRRSVDTPDRYSLPSLQTAGVAVARVGMAGELRRSTERSAQFHATSSSGGAPGIWAEDVTRGIRVDVYDVEAGRWYPLCDRTGTIDLPGLASIVENVAGAVSIAPTSAADDSVPDLYQPETLFHWTGWSLVVARPGAQIANRPNEAGETVPGEVLDPSNPAVARTPVAPHPDIDLTQEFSVPPGTLPRLRFGRTYRLRARTVDLAGNSEPFGDPTSTDFSRATPEFTFRRFEPVQSPPVVLRDTTVPAEEVERIVVRTDNDDGTFDTPTSERHAVPPKQSQIMAELLSRFDTGAGGAVDASRYAEIALADTIKLDGTSGGIAAPGLPDTFRFPDPMIPVGYLPDPLARGVTLRYVDGPLAGQSVQIPFDETAGWPTLRGMRLRALRGSGPASLVVDDSTERIVDVPLEEAEIVHVRVSCTSDESDLRFFAVWQWILDSAGPINITNLRNAAAEGRHWMLTPHRTLTFVHAVKRPLAIPTWAQPFNVSRTLGATNASIGRLLAFDRPSTQEVSVVGAWEEPVDLGPGQGVPDTVSPFTIQTEATAFEESFEYGPATPTTIFTGLHEFNDTKRRDVDYRLVGVSRFPEHFTVTTTETVPAVGTPVVLDAGGYAAGTVAVTMGDDTVSVTAYTTDPDAGTITFADPATVTSAPSPGESVDIRYVPGSIREVGQPERRIVPSSARPAAPEVEYVIPTFGWFSSSGAATLSARGGGGLRVYLQRPWWSSGEGELLGVVTMPAAEPGAATPYEVPNELAPYVTQWGLDPAYSSANLPHPHPRMGDFTSAVTTGTGLLLAETDLLVNVAGHQVGYDPDRDLWFCDLSVAAGNAYQPMIRLALARYQPESITGVHLSSIVLAEFSQLAPNRFAVMVGRRSGLRQLFVFGPSYGRTESRLGPGVVEAQVEVRDTGWGDETVGWRPVGRPTELAALGGTGLAMWSGTFTPPTGSRQHRLVITQYEEFRTDDGGVGTQAPPIGRRPVYTDILPLETAPGR